MPTEFQELVDRLGRLGYSASSRDESRAIVTKPSAGFTFGLYASGNGGFVQVAQILVEGIVIQASPHRDRLADLALRLHNRFLGCRFGYDDDQNLCVNYDAFPECQNAKHLDSAMQQMNYIGVSCLPLFEGVLKNGAVPDDRTIELALGEAVE